MYNPNQFNQFNQPFNVNNMNNNFNMNQAMMNMNQLMGMPNNMNQAQFIQMINSNPMMLMMWNQMVQNMQNMQNQGIMPNVKQKNEFLINLNFIDTNGRKIIIQTEPNEYMSSVINKYINKSNDFNNGKTSPNQINIAFIDNTGRKVVVQTTQEEYMSSVINKYINKSGDNNINLYLFNGKRVVQSLRVAEAGLTDGVEIQVSNVGVLKGAE